MAYDSILTNLAPIFAEIDAKFQADMLTWIEKRAEAVKAFREENSAKRREMGEHAYYTRIFNVAGGKTWYRLIENTNAAIRAEKVIKYCEKVIEARNQTIASKLDAAGVTEVFSSHYARTSDGFNGLFAVNTNTGHKAVSIQTIYAGGYNIQCAHQRTLIKIK